jgi:hypothetical protein
VRDVDADPSAIVFLRRVDRRTTAAERVEHDVAFFAAGGNDAFEQGKGLLGWVAKPFAADRIYPINVVPDVPDGFALQLIEIPLVLRHCAVRRPIDAPLLVQFV